MRLEAAGEREIRGFRRGVLLRGLFLRLLLAAAAFSFLLGLLTLAARLHGGFRVAFIPWGLAILSLALLAAVPGALRSLPSQESVRTLLEARARCGGLLVASAEVPLEAWGADLPALVAPRLRLRAARPAGLLAAGLVFLLGSLTLPVRVVSERQQLDVRRQAGELAKKVETLEEERLISPERSRELEERVERVAREASGEDPGRTFEALDRLEEAVRSLAREGAEKALERAGQLEEGQALAEGVAGAGEGLESGGLASAMAELSRRMAEALSRDGTLAGRLPEDLKKALGSGTLTREQLRRLAEALGASREQAMASVQKLGRAGLLDPGTLRQAGETGARKAREDLARFLAETSCQGAECVREWVEKPGRGGVTRGRGDAPLAFSGETTEDGARFREKTLPPAQVDALRESQLVAVTSAEPAAGAPGSRGSGALAAATASGGSATRARVLPRHRGAVERFFARPDTSRAEGKR